MSWFEKLTGFRELGYAQTQAQFEVIGNRLHSRVNGRSWQIGSLETPSLALANAARETLRLGDIVDSLLEAMVVHSEESAADSLEYFARGENRHGHVFYRWFNEVPVLFLLAIVILVVVKPF